MRRTVDQNKNHISIFINHPSIEFSQKFCKISVVIHKVLLLRYMIGSGSLPRKQRGSLAFPITIYLSFSLPVMLAQIKTETLSLSLLILPALNFFPLIKNDLLGGMRQNSPNSSPLKMSSGL